MRTNRLLITRPQARSSFLQWPGLVFSGCLAGAVVPVVTRFGTMSFVVTMAVLAVVMAVPLAIQERCIDQENRGRCRRGPAPYRRGSEGVAFRGTASSQVWGLLPWLIAGFSLAFVATAFTMETWLTVFTLGLSSLSVLRACTAWPGARNEGVLLTPSGFEVRWGGRSITMAWDDLQRVRYMPDDPSTLLITASRIETRQLVRPALPGTLPDGGSFFLHTERLPVDTDTFIRITRHFYFNPSDRHVLATELALPRIAALSHSTGVPDA